MVSFRFSTSESIADIPREYRLRVLMLLGFGILPFLVPFTFVNLLQQRYTMAGLTGGVCLVCAVNALAIYRGKQPPLPLVLQFGAILATLLYGISILGILATFWVYPVPLTYNFVCRRRDARIMETVYLLTVAPTAFYFLGLEMASRFVITLGLVCIFTNLLVGVIIDLQARLIDQANRDVLTGVFNRRFLSRALRMAAHRTRQPGGEANCLILLDIDHFKQVNDDYGHDAGDRTLTEVARLLREELRPQDELFRSGGEEFTILLPETSLAAAWGLAERLRTRVARAGILADHPVTISQGIAELQPNETITTWCKRADELLYEAKAAGRNCVRPVDPAGAISSPAPTADLGPPV